jgi:hypothetical protein
MVYAHVLPGDQKRAASAGRLFHKVMALSLALVE